MYTQLIKGANVSHFSQIKTKIDNREHLVGALEQLGLKPNVFETPQPLRGYYGEQDEYYAQIIIPGSSLQLCADIGFIWNETTGVYDLIHDSYETSRRLGKDFFTHQLLEKYGDRVIRAKAAELEQRLGTCSITEINTNTKQTLRLTFANHQVQQQYHRR